MPRFIRSLLSVALLGALVFSQDGLVQQAQALNTYSVDLERSSSQYLSITDGSQTDLDIANDLTIEAWVKIESTPGYDEHYMIVSKYDADNNQRAYSFEYVSSNDVKQLLFVTSPGCTTANQLAVGYTLSTGQWYHLAVSKSGSTATIYVNGSSVGSGTVSSGQCDSNADFFIGAIDGNSPSYFTDGLIDDVRVWNIARTGTEINDDKSRELYGNETGLVGYWKLNNNLNDSTSNGNTLTNNGSASHSASTPFSGFTETLKVRKTANESVSSSTILQNDDELKLSLAANKSYIIDGVLFASSTSATPDMIIAFFGQTDMAVTVGYTNDVNEMVLGSGATSSRIVLPANTPTSVHIKGTVKTEGTSGDFQLKWAQATSNANPTEILKGSYLKAEEI